MFRNIFFFFILAISWCFFGMDETFKWYEGLILLVLYFLYIVYLATLSKFETKIGCFKGSEDETSGTYNEDQEFAFYGNDEKEKAKVCIFLVYIAKSYKIHSNSLNYFLCKNIEM